VNYSRDLSTTGCNVGRRCQTTVSCAFHCPSSSVCLSVRPSIQATQWETYNIGNSAA